MLLQIEQQKKILNILRDLPPEKLGEVIDFVEYLKTMGKTPQKAKRKTYSLSIPTFHLGHIEKGAFDRNALYGEYLGHKFD